MKDNERNRLDIQLPYSYYECTLSSDDWGYKAFSWRNQGAIVSDLTAINLNKTDDLTGVPHVMQVYNFIITNNNTSSDILFRIVSYDPNSVPASGDFISSKIVAKAGNAFGFVADHPFVTANKGDVLGIYICSSDNIDLHVTMTSRHTPIS